MSIRRRSRVRLLLGLALVCGPFLISPGTSARFGAGWVSYFVPLQETLAMGGHHLAFGLGALAAGRRAANENRILRQQVAELQSQLAYEIAQSKAKDEKLRQLGEFARYRRDLVAYEAEVIGQGIGAQPGLIFIDRGSDSGVKPGMVVVVGHAIIGTVRAAAPRVSSVRLITSPGSRFDAQVATTGEKGIVVGLGNDTMDMYYVSQHEPEIGAAVVSRGLDGITPKHFLLGLVSKVRRRPGELKYDVTLRPAVKLDRLVSVVVVEPSLSGDALRRHAEEGGSDQ